MNIFIFTRQVIPHSGI